MRRRIVSHRVAAMSVLVGSLVLVSCGKPRDGTADASAGGSLAASRPDIVIICIDALRPDHLGCYGYERATSPTIDALAAESLVFEQTWSTSSWTKSAVPSLFTGLVPSQHRVFEGSHLDTPGHLTSDVLAAEHVTIAERLSAAGYRTGAFVKNAQLRSFLGFDQGFDLYVDDAGDAGEIVKGYLDWSAQDDSKPRFAYLHILDTHWPYRPKPPFATMFGNTPCRMDFATKSYRTLRDDINTHRKKPTAGDLARMVELYDGLIAQVDDSLGRLIESIRHADRPTVLMVTADHGEEFYEHGKIGHGQSVSELLLHIPLIVWMPGFKGRRIAEPSSLLDLMPTACGLAGVETPSPCLGRDLLAGTDRADTPRVIVAERRFSSRHLVAWREQNWKLVREFKDLGPRPAEQPGLLAVGLRCEVTIEAEADLESMPRRAHKLEIKEDQGETGIEVQGPLEAWESRSGTMRVLGFTGRLTGETRLRDTQGESFDPAGLTVGQGVEMDGAIEADGTMVLKKLTKVPSERVRLQIEGPLESVVDHHKSTVVTLAGRELRVTKDTRVQDRRSQKPAEAAAPGPPRPDPLRPECLISGEGLAVHDQLFDLGADHDEQHDLAGRRPDELARLGKHLAQWLKWLEDHSRVIAGERRELDDATIDALRETGYVH